MFHGGKRLGMAVGCIVLIGCVGCGSGPTEEIRLEAESLPRIGARLESLADRWEVPEEVPESTVHGLAEAARASASAEETSRPSREEAEQPEAGNADREEPAAGREEPETQPADRETEPREEPAEPATEESQTQPEEEEAEPAETEEAREPAGSGGSVVPVYFEGSESEILQQKAALGRGNSYYQAAGRYFESRGVTDLNNYDYLFRTDSQYYSAEDFSGCSSTILKLAKNEIYARHGRMFSDPELYEFFLTRMWYEPQYAPEEFDDSCLSDCERANLDLLVSLGA